MHVRVALEPARTNVISEYYVFAACEFYTETEKDLATYSRSIHEKSLRLIFAGGPERCVFFFLFLSDLHLFSSFAVVAGGALLKCKVGMHSKNAGNQVRKRKSGLKDFRNTHLELKHRSVCILPQSEPRRVMRTPNGATLQ